jgi:hypothetical protein
MTELREFRERAPVIASGDFGMEILVWESINFLVITLM